MDDVFYAKVGCCKDGLDVLHYLSCLGGDVWFYEFVVFWVYGELA